MLTYEEREALQVLAAHVRLASVWCEDMTYQLSKDAAKLDKLGISWRLQNKVSYIASLRENVDMYVSEVVDRALLEVSAC